MTQFLVLKCLLLAICLTHCQNVKIALFVVRLRLSIRHAADYRPFVQVAGRGAFKASGAVQFLPWQLSFEGATRDYGGAVSHVRRQPHSCRTTSARHPSTWSLTVAFLFRMRESVFELYEITPVTTVFIAVE